MAIIQKQSLNIIIYNIIEINWRIKFSRKFVALLLLKAVLHAAIFRAASHGSQKKERSRLATASQDLMPDRCCCTNRAVTWCNVLFALATI